VSIITTNAGHGNCSDSEKEPSVKRTTLFGIGLLLLAATTARLCADPISTAFAYQGRLQGSGAAISGTYDFHFAVYGSETNSDAVAETAVVTNVLVSGGRFTVLLDFGPGTFAGQARWLEIGVRTNGETSFTVLAPRQPMLAVPYALHAANAGLLNGTSNSVSVSTIISSSTIVSDQNLTNGITAGTNGGFVVGADGSVTSAGLITGNGGGLTNLPNVPSLVGDNAFSGINVFSNVITAFYPTTPWGNFIDFHRPNQNTPSGIRFLWDKDPHIPVEGPAALWVGMDYARQDGRSFFTLYDSVVGLDGFMFGFGDNLRGHFSMGLDGLAETATLSIHDIRDGALSYGDGIPYVDSNLTHSVDIYAKSNGIVINHVSPTGAYDSLILWRDEYASRWINWHQGDSTRDWRLGWVNTNYDLSFWNKHGLADQDANTPGDQVLRLHAGTPNYVWAREYLSGQPWHSLDRDFPYDPTVIWDNGAPGGSGGPNGWVGMMFTNGVDDLAITKLGRFTRYGLTNKTHQILLMTQSGTAMVTNTALWLPKSRTTPGQWVWADCYTVIPAGAVVWIITDTQSGGDYNGYWSVEAGYCGETNLAGGTFYGVYTNSVLSPKYRMPPIQLWGNYGPVSYVRRF
jgi:hypothetical protein